MSLSDTVDQSTAVSLPRRIARWIIWTLGIPDLFYRLEERRLARSAPRSSASEDGVALPPPLMRVLVAGSASPEAFLEIGRNTAAEFDAILAAHGRSFAASESILDIGCGCGRLARWVRKAGGQRIAGVDINAPMIRWCRRHIPGRWERIGLRQPLPFPAAEFDAAYACSVVTHLREETARKWFADLQRVLIPGGLLLVTFHDHHHATLARASAAPVAMRLAAKGYAVEIDRMEGSNRLAAYATIERLAELAGEGLALIEHRPSTDTAGRQAIAVFRRR